MKRFCTFLMLLLFSSDIYSNDLFALYKYSVSRQPYVIFLARDGLPGHAFVSVGEELDNGLMFSKGTFGFYPDDEQKLVAVRLLYSVDGVIDFRMEDLKHDLSFRVNITAEQQLRVESVLSSWKEKKYSLFGNNCSRLVSEVAQSIGFKLPNKSPGSVLPINYMRLLKDINNL